MKGGERLEELYFRWLYEQVAYPGFHDQNLTHWRIMKILFTTEFVWIVPNDENRISDGVALRREFLDILEEQGVPYPEADSQWMTLGCSLLELMVGLARRLEFDADNGEAHYWFWAHLMNNLGIDGYNDRKRLPRREVKDVLERLIFRTYEPNGEGGFFPLQFPSRDQRKVELLYQMSDYLLERGLAG